MSEFGGAKYLHSVGRKLLLPVAPSKEHEFEAIVRQILKDEYSISVAQQDAWIAVQLRTWRRNGEPSKHFRALVRKLLYDSNRTALVSPVFPMGASNSGAGGEDLAYLTAREYFNIHSTLLKSGLVSHDEARRLLSYLRLIVRLHVEDRMSSAQITQVVLARDPTFQLNWKAVQTILVALKLKPELNDEDITRALAYDADMETQILAELSIEESIEYIDAVAVELGCPKGIADGLKALFLSSELHNPFIFILHYQLLALHKYDHALTFGYEFSPRGVAVNQLLDRHWAAGVHTGKSPYLNNAKALERFGREWGLTRCNPKAAVGLTDILATLEALDIGSKREIGEYIRALLAKYLRIHTESLAGHAVPNELHPLSSKQVGKVTGAAAAGNTVSTGIIEQRLVDCYATWAHRDSSSVPHGVGDSVFAANLPRKKFGDCEFIEADEPIARIHAYEAHAGLLTADYVADHLATARIVLEARREELATIAPKSSWLVIVTFVATRVDESIDWSEYAFEVDGVTIKASSMDFSWLDEAVATDGKFVDIFNDFFISHMNSHLVHPDVRSRVLEIQTLTS